LPCCALREPGREGRTNALARGFDCLTSRPFPKIRNRLLTVCPGGNDRQLSLLRVFTSRIQDFTNTRIAAIQKISVTDFVTAPTPEVHRDVYGRQSACTSSSSCSLAAALITLIDFSFDYQDLLFKPAEKKP